MGVENTRNSLDDQGEFTIEQGFYKPQTTRTTPMLREIVLSFMARLNPLSGKTNTTWDTAPSEIIR